MVNHLLLPPPLLDPKLPSVIPETTVCPSVNVTVTNLFIPDHHENMHQLSSLPIPPLHQEHRANQTHLVVLAETSEAGTVALPVIVSTPPSALVLTYVVPTTAEEGPAELPAADDPPPVVTA